LAFRFCLFFFARSRIYQPMAIVRVTGGGGGLERRVGLKAAKKAAKKGAKKGAKHAIEKHAAKKWAIEKHAGKKAAKEAAKKAAKKVPAKVAPLQHEPTPAKSSLTHAFHHLQRAAAVISLLEPDSGGDLRSLLEQGVELYRRASEKGAGKKLAGQAFGILSAAEHMGMAGLYSARAEFRIEVPEPPAGGTEEHLRKLRGRLETLGRPSRPEAEMLLGAAWELLRRADAAGDDPHLEWELAMAADGLCTALENGF
jgi:hypothetical protein